MSFTCAYCKYSFDNDAPIMHRKGLLYHPHCLERMDKEKLWNLEGLKYDCPKCFGANMLCPICKGKGRIKDEPKPVIDVVGWEIGGIFYNK